MTTYNDNKMETEHYTDPDVDSEEEEQEEPDYYPSNFQGNTIVNAMTGLPYHIKKGTNGEKKKACSTILL